jgi:hypothetical protein
LRIVFIFSPAFFKRASLILPAAINSAAANAENMSMFISEKYIGINSKNTVAAINMMEAV